MNEFVNAEFYISGDEEKGLQFIGRVVDFTMDYDADLYWLQRLSNGGLRQCPVKVFGFSNPWSAFHALEKLCAASPFVLEVGMYHTHLKGYGK